MVEVETGKLMHNGFRLYYEVYGQGTETVIFTNGLLLDGRTNRALARSMARAGHRVILLDLLGHGNSDRPAESGRYRMDLFADQVIATLDHFGVDRAVVGGVSLGAGVSLQVATRFPERVRALLLEMPVMEQATPFAALLLTPLLLAVDLGRPVVRGMIRLLHKLPNTGNEVIDSVLDVSEPEVTAAILHGILVGPVVPSVEQRRAIDVPTLVLGHTGDKLHPFDDAFNLATQIPNAVLEEASSIMELRFRPKRLTQAILSFLGEVRAQDQAAGVRPVPGSANA